MTSRDHDDEAMTSGSRDGPHVGGAPIPIHLSAGAASESDGDSSLTGRGSSCASSSVTEGGALGEQQPSRQLLESENGRGRVVTTTPVFRETDLSEPR